MLDEARITYLELANMIPDWKKYNKNELCNLYIEHENEPIAESYLAAIILKYWRKIDKFYNQSKPAATMEECYDWLIDSIHYALKHRKWKDKNNKLYTDPNAPDKVINNKMRCMRLTYFQQLFSDKRKIRVNCYSSDAIYNDNSGKEETISWSEPEDNNTSDTSSNVEYNDIVNTYVVKRKYKAVLILDAIYSGEGFIYNKDTHSTEFSIKALAKSLKNITDSYVISLCNTYNIDVEDIMNTIEEEFRNKSTNYIIDTVSRIISQELKHSPEIINWCYN